MQRGTRKPSSDLTHERSLSWQLKSHIKTIFRSGSLLRMESILENLSEFCKSCIIIKLMNENNKHLTDSIGYSTKNFPCQIISEIDYNTTTMFPHSITSHNRVTWKVMVMSSTPLWSQVSVTTTSRAWFSSAWSLRNLSIVFPVGVIRLMLLKRKEFCLFWTSCSSLVEKVLINRISSHNICLIMYSQASSWGWILKTLAMIGLLNSYTTL